MEQETTSPDEASNPLEYITTAAGSGLIMTGPLALAYSEGLNQLYAKERSDAAVALETQAVDMGLLRKKVLVSKKALLDTDDRASMGMFYGVQQGAIEVKHLIDVVDRLAQMNDVQRARSAVVIDTVIKARAGLPFEEDYAVCLEALDASNNLPMHDALVSACKAKGVSVYSSFGEFAQKHL